jgi:hypothetical protein
MPRKYNKTKKSFIVSLPIECLSVIDAFKNCYVGEEWNCRKLTSRGKIIQYIIEDWKKIKGGFS